MMSTAATATCAMESKYQWPAASCSLHALLWYFSVEFSQYGRPKFRSRATIKPKNEISVER